METNNMNWYIPYSLGVRIYAVALVAVPLAIVGVVLAVLW